jgi:hypothetical protein
LLVRGTLAGKEIREMAMCVREILPIVVAHKEQAGELAESGANRALAKVTGGTGLSTTRD